ncbi:MAG: hypothetical protein GC139_06310 [Sideroxydans sp.]|nr:hypothetical protein [Sideroxydans sp.]
MQAAGAGTTGAAAGVDGGIGAAGGTAVAGCTGAAAAGSNLICSGLSGGCACRSASPRNSALPHCM